ncbi:MAG TPA: hypothetical protein VJ770_01955 [Stellaceae bacterium]|nr:hypothetical protein [Stellaceae bacterium]
MAGRFAVLVRDLGLSLFVALGMAGQAWAQAYLPDGPNVPLVTLNEGQSGAAGLPPLPVPPPNGWDQQSIWNMQVVGFNDNQGRASSDDGWIEDENGRYIAYVADSPGSAPNPLTGQPEPNGTSLIDVTNPAKPVFLHHIPAVIPGSSGSTHVAVCGGATLPGVKNQNKWFLIRHSGSVDQEIWDVSDPSNPSMISVLIGGPNAVSSSLTGGRYLTANHHIWWECDTGVAYVIAQSDLKGSPLNWNETGSKQHIYIYDLSNPYNPAFIREFGLVGQQPGAVNSGSCYNAPGPNCYEGNTNPPGGIHQVYSAGLYNNRVYLPYGVGADGVVQVVDRTKLLTGCTVAGASANCADFPTQADLLYPQISYITMKTTQGAHTSIPIFGIPIPEMQANYLDGTPQKWDLLAITSEQTANDCAPQDWKNPQLLDITPSTNSNGVPTETLWPISTLPVGQFPGDFCNKGARFGIHELNREIYAPYYGRLIVAAYFNAGLHVWDIRDPYSPRQVAYFIQAPNANTLPNCSSTNPSYCRAATFSDLGEVDDRGYIYNMDRAGSGLTILKLTGNAAHVVTGQGDEGH